MGYAEATTLIHAPVEAVWNALNDIDHTPDWVVGLEKAEIVTPGDYGLGAIYHDHNRLGPLPQVTPWHVTTFEPMIRQVHESQTAALPSRMTLTLTPAPEGTRLHMAVEYRFLPRLGVISRILESLVMNRVLTGVLRQNQANLNAYLTRLAGNSAGIKL
ncbi:MAG: SRPBCC family protein [Chloroflexi bacterium]|nr:SRPBCC family protein [Chloroflexota bacterium]